jgi:YHS domain-containing protein
VVRFLALAVLAFLLFLVVRASVHAFLGGLRGGRRPEMTRRGRDDLVKDPVCETYIPRRKAITRGSGPATRYFCSAACADKYAARS